MKRVRLLSLLLLLAFFLSACGSGDSDVIDCTWDEIMQSGIAFRVEGLYGQSPEALSAREKARNFSVTGFYAYLDTDLYLFFREGLGVPFVYDKGNGTVTFACRDETCSHTDCIWAKAGTQVYSGGDVLFFYLGDEETVYAGDMYGENLRALYTSDEGHLYGFFHVGAYLYMLEDIPVMIDGVQNSTNRWLRIPVNGGNAEALEEAPGSLTNPTTLEDFCLYYYGDRGKVLYGEWLYYIELVGEWEPDKPNTLWRMSRYDRSVREPLFECADDTTLHFSGDTMYILEKTPYSKSYEFGTYYAWNLYTADLQGNDKTFRMTFETDGIPDKIEDLRIDGNLLYLRYRTYLDFRNEYCPRGATGETHTMLVDLSNDRRILFGNGEDGV